MRKAWTNFSAAGAIISSLATLSCCLPPAILAAGGFAALATLPSLLRPWLIFLSVGFLAVGAVTAIRGARCGSRVSKSNWILLALAALIVLLTTLFPQFVAGIVADLFYRAGP